jgi:hypothetical protein
MVPMQGCSRVQVPMPGLLMETTLAPAMETTLGLLMDTLTTLGFDGFHVMHMVWFHDSLPQATRVCKVFSGR